MLFFFVGNGAESLYPVGLSQDKGRTDFFKNLRASSYNKELSNETTFSQIHLPGQSVPCEMDALLTPQQECTIGTPLLLCPGKMFRQKLKCIMPAACVDSS